MELTPNDIRNYEFQTQMRGYDKDEVDSLIKRLAEMFDELKQENLKLSMENDSLGSQLESLKELEETIKTATIDARKNADALLTKANEEATKIVQEAKAEAEDIIGSRIEERDALERKIRQLEETRKSFVDNLQGLISSHLSQIDSPPPVDSASGEVSETPRSVQEMSEEMLENLSESLEEDVEDEVPADEEQADDQEDVGADESDDDDDEFEDEPAGLDPELASTATNYEHVTSEDVDEQVDSQVDDVDEQVDPQVEVVDEPVNPQVEVVETTKTAEEIPDGFIVQDEEYVNTNDTIPIDSYIKSSSPKTVTTEKNESVDDDISPENLAATLDSVVAKFEEEMDKADKS